ncbi:GNAT family N-acetyltransferase [Spirosoma sp.]|uniref:GNAT family N-acetyltransferase n=1 Tax=Spirosoma sp. TaxID=1899569 RepID=UPI00260D5252|nr:GNAT family N-acetyltransferase [Spirosoma sp.]MCX6218046.1 GNAT family N-acetyltransferase [Spirosoma sp.]
MLLTERLLLTEFTVDDAAFVLTLLNTPSWLEFIGDRGVRTLDDAHQYIVNGPLKSYELMGYGSYVVRLKVTEQPIGMCGLFKRETLDAPDIGFAFLPGYTGTGYGFEAASAVIAYARETFGSSRILGFTSPANQPSIHLLEKLGLRFERKFMYKADGEESLLFGTPAIDV